MEIVFKTTDTLGIRLPESWHPFIINITPVPIFRGMINESHKSRNKDKGKDAS